MYTRIYSIDRPWIGSGQINHYPEWESNPLPSGQLPYASSTAPKRVFYSSLSYTTARRNRYPLPSVLLSFGLKAHADKLTGQALRRSSFKRGGNMIIRRKSHRWSENRTCRATVRGTINCLGAIATGFCLTIKVSSFHTRCRSCHITV